MPTRVEARNAVIIIEAGEVVEVRAAGFERPLTFEAVRQARRNAADFERSFTGVQRLVDPSHQESAMTRAQYRARRIGPGSTRRKTAGK